MKKIILMTILIIFIPFIVVTLFIKNEEIKFNFISNTIVRVKRSNGNIDKIPFEQYIKGVLAGEMPTSFHIEALKAQAVAARSYVMKKMQDNAKEDYDILDTVMNQVYLDENQLKEKWKDKYNENNNKLKKAVIETKGEYLSYDNKVIEAFFFSTSTGKTENSGEVFSNQLPYLISVDSSWDEDVSPVFKEINHYTLEEFYKLISIPYNEKLKINIKTTTSTGRIKELEINDHLFMAKDISSKLNLKSTFFEIKQENNNIVVTTKGYGHGVGMSQYGALAMAKKGYKYSDILKHYYKGIEIKKI